MLLEQAHLDTRVIACDHADAELLFTGNDSNAQVLWGVTFASPWVKDALHRLVVRGERAAVSPERCGTKCAWRMRTRIPPGGLRLRMAPALHDEPFHDADARL